MTTDGRRGLICHDEVAMRRALGVIMQRCGYAHVDVTDFAREAIAAAERFQPDAVVVDLALTGELGLRAVRAFAAASPGCLVVVLSPFSGLRRRAREAGGLALVDPNDLRHVEDWLLLGADPSHPAA